MTPSPNRRLATLLTVLLGLPLLGQELRPPVRLEADGQPVDTTIGHAAPYLCDFDGDGRRDLLVGQFGEGKLRIYRNVGSEKEPRYGAPEWFQAGGAVATVPAG